MIFSARKNVEARPPERDIVGQPEVPPESHRDRVS